jgi:hypothetical protein
VPLAQAGQDSADRRQSGRAMSTIQAQDALAAVLIAAVWAAIALAIGPFVDIPVNDDWMFGGSVAALLAGEGLRVPGAFHGIIVSPLLTQTPWGALFCLPFGFSFIALRVSTLTFGLFGLAILFAVLRQAGCRRPLAVTAALALAVNPLFVALSGTFMTDVPLTVLMLAAVYAFTQSFWVESRGWLIAGIGLSFAAVLTRQTGLAPLIGYAIAHAVKTKFRPVPALLGVIPLILGIGLLFAYQAWLTASGRGPAVEHLARIHAIDPADLVSWAIHFLLFAFPYLGLAALPALPVAGPLQPGMWRTGGARLALAAMGLASMVALAFLWVKNDLLPVMGNIILETGLGPLTQRDTLLLKINLPTAGPGTAAFWLIVTACAVIGFTALVIACGTGFQPGRAPAATEWSRDPAWLRWMAAGTALGYWAILTVRSYQNTEIFDRYLLPIIPLALVLLATAAGRAGPGPMPAWRTGLAAVFLIVMGGFSVAGMHDYLAWNRARWAALHHLTDDLRVPPTNIDGGYEFNGSMERERGYQPPAGKSWWFVHGDEYLAASGPVEGYQEIARYPVEGKILPVGVTQVVILRRTGR